MHKNNKKWAINNLKFLARYVCIFSYSLLHEAAPNLSSHLELLVISELRLAGMDLNWVATRTCTFSHGKSI